MSLRYQIFTLVFSRESPVELLPIQELGLAGIELIDKIGEWRLTQIFTERLSSVSEKSQRGPTNTRIKTSVFFEFAKCSRSDLLIPGGRKWSKKMKRHLNVVPDGVPSGPKGSQMIVWTSLSHHKKTGISLARDDQTHETPCYKEREI